MKLLESTEPYIEPYIGSHIEPEFVSHKVRMSGELRFKERFTFNKTGTKTLTICKTKF